MTTTTPIVTSWGDLSLPQAALGQLVVEMDNGVGALPAALTSADALVVWGDPNFWDPWGGSGSNVANEFTGRRLSYMETLHDLTNAPCDVFEVFAGVTTATGFNTQLALRTGSPLLVFRMTVNDTVNGDQHTYVFAEAALDITGLYEHPVFTGVVQSWRYHLNRMTLTLTSTERSESMELPGKVVTAASWPNAGDAVGSPYPIVYGQPGTTLDADKVETGFGSVPAVLVDPTARKYVLAGHTITAVGGETNEANSVTLYAKLDGFDGALAYVEGFSFDKADTDAEGNTIAHVTKSGLLALRLFIHTTGDGSNFSSTAGTPTNATGRDTTTEAELEPGEVLSLAIGTHVGTLPAVQRVFIRTSKSSSDLRCRWTGVSSTITGSNANGPTIALEDADRWDETGKVEISGTVYDYTGITRGTTDARLLISAYGGPSSGTAISVGAWQTLSSDQQVDVTDQRDWTESDFSGFEVELENTSGVTTHNVSYLGLLAVMGEVRVQGVRTLYPYIGKYGNLGYHERAPDKPFTVSRDPFRPSRQVRFEEVRGEALAPRILVPCQGRSITFRSTSYGASRNPAVQLADLYVQELGFAESDLGDTVDSAISLQSGWNLDWALAVVSNSRGVIDEVMRQARMFEWRDEENKVQFGVIRTDAGSDVTLDADDLIDSGDGLVIEPDDGNNVFNQVFLRWGTKPGGAFENLYFITEDDSNPEDVQREALAQASIDAHRVTRRLEVEAPMIQEAATAVQYLQFLFDFHRTRRRRAHWRIPMHVPLRPGQVARLVSAELDVSENFLVQEVTRERDTLVCEGLGINLEAGLEDQIGYEVTVTTALAVGWGSPDFWDPWGGSVGTESAETTGRVVDYGLSLLANRHFEDTSEKIAWGAWGTGVTALSAGQVDLETALGSRVGIGAEVRSGTEVTIPVSFPSGGTERNIDEAGLFTGQTGSNMVARILFASAVNVPSVNALVVYFRIRIKRPSGGTSGATDYGLDLLAQRMYQDTAEKPTHMAIGTDSTAQAGTDVTLGAQISSRVTIHADYPQAIGMSSDYRGDYDAATYGGNTLAEYGIFTGSTGSNCIARRVPADAVALGALDDFIQRHRLTAVHYT